MSSGNLDRFSVNSILSCKVSNLYSKTYVKRATLKMTKIGLQDQLSLNVGRKYCRMLSEEHLAILSTFIKLPFVIKIFVLSIFELPFYTGFTVHENAFYLNLEKYPFKIKRPHQLEITEVDSE